MRKTALDKIPITFPFEFERLLTGAPVYDSSCSPEARVYFIDKDGGYYLKCAKAGMLAREAQMTEYFHSKGIGAEVLGYHSDASDFLLTAQIVGEDCIYERYLADPKRLCDTLAETLRELHESDYTGCPVMNRTQEYLAFAEENYRADWYDKTHFPNSFGYRSAEEAYAVLQEGKDALKCDVLLHGDYCLPNILLDNWRLSGLIDVGNGGVGDRHIDVFWGAWTLWFNLGTDRYRDRFLDAYGRDKVDESVLKIVAAAEVFG